MSNSSGYGDEDGIYRSTVDEQRRLVLPSHPHQSWPAFLFKGEVGDPSRASKTLLIDAASGMSISCGEFRRLVASVGGGLSTVLGVKQGDVILILLSNTVYFPVIFNAILSIGAIATTANPASPAEEIRRQIADSSAAFAITMPDLASKIFPFSGRTVLLNSDSSPGSSLVRFESLLSVDPSLLPQVRIRLGDTAAILYSSGTTGRSKGVVLSHGNFIAAVSSVSAPSTEKQEEDKSDMVAFVIIPMFHIAGLVWLGCSVLRSAATLVVLRRFDFIDMLDAIERYKVTNLPLVPPLVVAFNKHPAVAKYDLSSLRRAASGAAPLKKDTIESFLAKFPQITEFAQGYGMTETTGLGTAGESPLGSAGRLMPTLEAIVMDVDTGRRLPPNHRGELLLRGPCLMQAYLNNSQATVETIDPEGWLRTGDLVYFDDDGFLYIVDRLKELIKFKGFQVPPAELEALLLTHPCIADAAVVPFPDEDAGEIPLAFVVRAQDKSLTDADVMSFVAQKVAPYKKVRRVAFVDAIPKSAAGKILRKDLVKLTQTKSRL